MTVVSVTAEHIAKGEQGCCLHCPVALALADAFPDLGYISAGPDNIIAGATGAEVILDIPAEVAEFIKDFDTVGVTVEPFTFDLDYPAVTS